MIVARCVFFFFQAEDGIRDWSVTGVQTCALPICEVSVEGGTADPVNNLESVWAPAGASGDFTVRVVGANIAGDGIPGNSDSTDQDRSEERRVGKESRCRGAPDH